MTKKWYAQHKSDPYVKRANREGVRSRAAYKLLEIQQKRSIIKSGHRVVDLGAAPGAWSEALVSMVGPSGTVVACDLLDMKPIGSVHFIKGNFLEGSTIDAMVQVCPQFDVIVSDMAPNLTGNVTGDQVAMGKLITQIFTFASAHLSPGGSIIAKCFHGPLFDEVRTVFKQHCQQVTVYKPNASRQASKEIYLIGDRFEV